MAKRPVFIVIFFFMATTIAQGQNAQQRKDSLSRTGSRTDDRDVPTAYLFDSLFVVSDQFLKKHIRLAKTMTRSSQISHERDSAVVYVMTGRSVILNGKLATTGIDFIFIEKCSKRDVGILSRKSLAKKYGIQNPNGAYVISCSSR